MTSGSCSPGAWETAQNAISSPSSELTACTRSPICLNSSPVSEFHQAPNAALSADC